MIAAQAYILLVPETRREIILDHNEHGSAFYTAGPVVAEPVPRFEHSRRAPLVVLASFKDGFLTHIADGRKGASAGTGLVRLNMENLQKLKRPIGFEELVNGVAPKIRPHLKRKLEDGGILPPRTLAAVVDRILELDKSLEGRLRRFSARRAEAIRRLNANERENLALQKEGLGLALEIAGVSRDELLAWQPGSDAQQSFLDGLPEAQVREDAMLLTDFSNVPGFSALSDATHIGAKTFVSPLDTSLRLTVIMANRLPLEQQTGADLIYFNERFRSFVFVQYKAMEGRGAEVAFRWQAGDQFMQEVARMDQILTQLRKIGPNTHPDGYRFCENPFFLKFCPRVVLNPDDKGLFKGIYLPLDLWKLLDTSGKLRGEKGGRVLTFENVGRRISNSEFVGMVSNAWVGTSIDQSKILEQLIREVLQSGKTVTFAIKSRGEEDSIELAVDPVI